MLQLFAVILWCSVSLAVEQEPPVPAGSAEQGAAPPAEAAEQGTVAPAEPADQGTMPPAEETKQDKKLPTVVLKGEDGGTATGEAWNSSDLIGKTNLILYVDTGKRQQAMPLINRIDELSYPEDKLGVSFVINTSATSIPSFMIRMMIKQREKANSKIRYVLDKKEMLIRDWDFTDEFVNVLILDPTGKVLHRYAGEITEEYVDQVISIIENGLKNKS
jgi:predicted transcriptional regulator